MATFGRNSTSTTYTTIENQLTGAVFTLTGQGTITSIIADINCTTSAKNMKCQIYRHSDLALMAQTIQQSVPVGHAQRTFTFASNPELPAGDYVLSAWSVSGSGNGQISYAVGAANQGHYDPATYGTAPNPMVPTHNSNVYNIYATYDPVITIDYRQMFFNTPSEGGFVSITDGVKPHFICPNCHYEWQGLKQAASDINELVVFTCPSCSKTIALFIKISGSNLTIQRSDAEGAGGIL